MQRTPSLRQIEVFWAVSEAGSVSGAARTLNVAQPGLSRMLRHMEAGLGFALFDRNSGRLVATPEGEALLRAARGIHERVGEFGLLAGRLARAEGGSLRVGCGGSVANWPVPAALARVTRALPALAVRLDTLGVSEMADYLHEGRGDAVVALSAIEHPAFLSQRLGEVPLLCAMPPGHPLAALPRVSVAEVNAHPMVTYDAGSSLGQAMRRALAPVGGVPARIGGEVRFAAAALALVEAGLGLALVDAAAAGGGGEGRLAYRPVTPPLAFSVHLAVTRRAGRSIPVQLLAKEIGVLLSAMRKTGMAAAIT